MHRHCDWAQNVIRSQLIAILITAGYMTLVVVGHWYIPRREHSIAQTHIRHNGTVGVIGIKALTFPFCDPTKRFDKVYPVANCVRECNESALCAKRVGMSTMKLRCFLLSFSNQRVRLACNIQWNVQTSCGLRSCKEYALRTNTVPP